MRKNDSVAFQQWTQWLARYPDRTDDVDEATRLVHSLDAYQPGRLSEAGIEREITQLHQRLAREPDTQQPNPFCNHKPTGTGFCGGNSRR